MRDLFDDVDEAVIDESPPQKTSPPKSRRKRSRRKKHCPKAADSKRHLAGADWLSEPPDDLRKQNPDP